MHKKDFKLWKFWTKTNIAKILLSLLLLSAISLVLFPIIIMHEIIETKIENDIQTTIIIQERKIPESYLVVITFIVFLILLPKISKIKLGFIELELNR